MQLESTISIWKGSRFVDDCKFVFDVDTPIVVSKGRNGLEVNCGVWRSGPLSWDEAIGTVAAALVPPRGNSHRRVGHMIPAIDEVRAVIRYRGLIETFGDRERK